MNPSGRPDKEVSIKPDNLACHSPCDRLYAVPAFAIPNQPGGNNWRAFGNEFLYEAAADEADGDAPRVLWQRTGLDVWPAQRQIRVHNVRRKAQRRLLPELRVKAKESLV